MAAEGERLTMEVSGDERSSEAFASTNWLSGGLPVMVAGMRVFQTPMATEPTDRPVRPHKKTRSMSEAYHRRIQKKWVKRFGYERKPCIFQTPHGFFVHPALMPQLRAALAR